MLMYYNGCFLTKNPSQTLSGKMMCLLHQVEVLVEMVLYEVLVSHKVLDEENLHHPPKQEHALLVEGHQLVLHAQDCTSFFLSCSLQEHL